MENPEHEIRPIIRSLCQGTVAEQQRTLERFFTKNASFVHPFCIAPSFGKGHIPALSQFSSRDVMRSIFQWYRMMSPKIDIEIDAALHDKIRDKMYVDIRQTFSLWFIPMYHAHVRLVTVLDLVANDDADFHDPLDRIIKQEKEGGEKPTAQLLYHASLANENHHHNHHNNNKGHGPRRYKIHRQEDLYQVNEFLKFVGGPGPLPFLWFLFQMQATALCIFMSLFVRLSPWRFQPEPARGGVEAIIERVESYHDLPSSERLEEKSHSHQRENKPKSKPQKKVEEEKPTTPINEKTHESGNGSENRDTAESTSTVGATNGHNGQPHEQPHAQQHMQSQEKHHEQPQTQHHTQPNELPHPQSNAQREQRPKHEQNNGSGPNSGDTRRESANSKASPTQPRKQGKSGKKGGSGGGGR